MNLSSKLIQASSYRIISPVTRYRLLSDSVAAEGECKPFSAMPGPKPLPVVGNMRDMYNNSSTFHLYLDKCFKEYGDIFKLKIFGTS